VEAGAYKKGEIKKICRMVAPRMAVITAVKDSHLALFGSLEQIKQTKFELIESLPSFGTAFFNTGNEGAHDLSKRAKTLELAKIITYSAVGEADLQATDMQESSDGLQFKVKGVHFSTAVPAGTMSAISWAPWPWTGTGHDTAGDGGGGENSKTA